KFSKCCFVHVIQTFHCIDRVALLVGVAEANNGLFEHVELFYVHSMTRLGRAKRFFVLFRFRLVSSCFRAIHLSSRSFLLLTLQHLFNKKICLLQVVGDLMIRGYLIMPVLMERGQTIQYGLIHIDLGPKLMGYTYAMLHCSALAIKDKCW